MPPLIRAWLAYGLLACAPASIGSYPDTDDSARGRLDPDAGSAAAETELTVMLEGTGSGLVDSTPGGLACTGATCSGLFDRGTNVTLTPKPAPGSVFAGWRGACNGTEGCSVTMTGDVDVVAEFHALGGTWSGTYANQRMASGCTFENAGELSVTVEANGSAVTSSLPAIKGLEVRLATSCLRTGARIGSANSSPVTLTSGTLTGTWNVTVEGIAEPLSFPFSAKIEGSTMTGTWTCSTCTGSFSLKRM